MSIHVYRWVVKHGTAKDMAEQAVLLNLADHAGKDDGRDAFPSVATIAREIAASEDTVRRALKRLVKDERIRCDGWHGEAGKQTRNYTVVTPWTPDPPHAAGGGAAPEVAHSGAPPAACSPNPRTLPPKQPGNNHGSAEKRAQARATAPPSLAHVEQVLRDVLPQLPDGRLRIKRSKIAKVLHDFPAPIDEHVLAAHFVAAKALENAAPNGEQQPLLHADRLLWSYLRNNRQTQLDFEHEAKQ